jgi:hypothetical protein
VTGDQNIFVGNSGSFEVHGFRNLILWNTSVTGSHDAVDASGARDANYWLFNTFAPADPACLLEPPHT